MVDNNIAELLKELADTIEEETPFLAGASRYVAPEIQDELSDWITDLKLTRHRVGRWLWELNEGKHRQFDGESAGHQRST
jgi:hypothetical protein